MNRSDTQIGIADSDTMCLRFAKGQRVRITAGALKGTEGIVIESRPVGRALVRLGDGLFVEIHQFCLQSVGQS